MTTPELNFATPAELLAALPYLLGFVPHNDLVALMLGHTDHPERIPVRAAIRGPITIDEVAAQRFPATCNLTAENFPAACLIAVCDPGHDEHALHTLRIVRTAMSERGIHVRRLLTTHSLTQAGRWVDPDTGHSGPTIAYTDLPATALGVLRGHVIAPSRDHLQREFTTTEPAPHVDAEAQDITALIAATATDLRRVITGYGHPGPDLASRAALVVTAHVALRDSFLRLAAGNELVAGKTWTHIAAAHRGRTRAELLTMAAIAYYCAGDTVRAGMACTYAAEAVRDDGSTLPRLTTMLHTALQAGMPPENIRGLIPTREKLPIPGTDL